MSLSGDIGVWVAALVTLAIFSFLYKENPIYRFAEHLLVGVSAGYYLVQYFFSSLVKKLYFPVVENQDYALIFGGILGLSIFLRSWKRTAWVSNYAIAFYVATWAGYLVPSVVQARILVQMQATMANPFQAGTLWATISAFLVTVGVLTTLVYFYFSAEHRGVVKRISGVGIAFLMVGFGASFGYTIMGRVTLLIGRMQFLFENWLGIMR